MSHHEWRGTHLHESHFRLIPPSGSVDERYPFYIRIQCHDCGGISCAIRSADMATQLAFKDHHATACPVARAAMARKCIGCEKELPEDRAHAVHGNADAWHCEDCAPTHGCRDC